MTGAANARTAQTSEQNNARPDLGITVGRVLARPADFHCVPKVMIFI